jgi:hypothetical protein
MFLMKIDITCNNQENMQSAKEFIHKMKIISNTFLVIAYNQEYISTDIISG